MFRCCAHYTLVAGISSPSSSARVSYFCDHGQEPRSGGRQANPSYAAGCVSEENRHPRGYLQKETPGVQESQSHGTEVRGSRQRLKSWEGELSDEVSSCDALLGETSLEGETSSDSSSSSEDAVEEATVLAKKAVKAKPVAAADAAKDKEERKGGKGGKGPPEELRRGLLRRYPDAGAVVTLSSLQGTRPPTTAASQTPTVFFNSGFPKGHPQRCECCEVLRRGISRTGKKHTDDCRWRSRGLRSGGFQE